jgi:hypothetical protein
MHPLCWCLSFDRVHRRHAGLDGPAPRADGNYGSAQPFQMRGMLSPVHSGHAAHHFRQSAALRSGGHSGTLRPHTPASPLVGGGGGMPLSSPMAYGHSPLSVPQGAELARTPTWTHGTPTGDAGNSPFAWTPDGASAQLSGPLSQPIGPGGHQFPDPAAKTLHDEVLKVRAAPCPWRRRLRYRSGIFVTCPLLSAGVSTH